MLMRSIQVFRQLLSVTAVFAAVSVSVLYGEDDKVAYDYYTSPEGTTYVAVGFRGVAVPSDAVTEAVFLVDTSASQVGQVRQDVLKTLADTINELPANARIQVFAMDVDTESLTGGFVQNGSTELLDALKKLQRKVPLGATDMANGLNTVEKAFEKRDTNARRAVVYFGDGRSMAKTINPKEFGQIVDGYVAARIPFNACAAGIATNLGLLGAFANQTGGNLVDMNAKIAAETEKALEQAEASGEQYVNLPDFSKSVGKRLAEAVNATVVWANQDSYSFPKDWTVYPQKLQPIRSDRETIVVGKTNAESAPFTLKLKGGIPGNEMELAWDFAPNTEPGVVAGSNYLAAVVDMAAKDNGLTMPIVGWDTLAVLREGFINHLQDQLDKADTAIKTGNKNQAIKLADNVLRQDPDNGTARRLFVKAEKAVEGQPELIDDNGIETAEVVPALVDSVAIGQSVSSQKIQNEVRQAIVDATQRMNDDPEGAIQTIRLTQAMVRDNTSLDPNERNLLLDRLGSVLKQAQHTQYVTDFRRQQADENAAAERERQQTLYDMQTARDKAVQIFDRFNSLMSAKEYKVAQNVAVVAMEMLPDHTEPFAAQRVAEMVSYITEYAELRHKRHIGFVESLMVAERSFIPIPEEPPITYIDPEKWMLLSERRKERYAVSDLSQSGPVERKINKALDKNIDIKLDESMTFEDLFRMIKDKNPGINVALDPKGAGGLGVTSAAPLVKEPAEYNGIKLRNVLKIILSEQDLTYCIKDEVLLITSAEEAKKYMSVKVYPMADLVVSPAPIGGMGGGMMGGSGGMGGMMNGGGMGGGMSGGMGGMSGGMGGMSGGMGGGMGGMGGGMGGGGMWNIPSAVRGMLGSQLLNGKPANGFGGMFSVPDEVQKDIPAQARQTVEEAKKAESAEVFWDNYFSKGKQNKDLVWEMGRRMLDELKAKKPVADQIVAFINSAILNDNVQPWMYEALTITLYTKGAPMKEVERAALSAADFCDNPLDLMNLGLLLRSIGLKERAFFLYKQSLEVMSPNQEFYSAALRLAEELYNEKKDEDSLRWITLAVLSQEWDGNVGRKMSQKALDDVQMLEAKMKKENRTEEADQFSQEIREARLRDCVVTVEWTGNAGMDMMIREPTDSYCWSENPRTTVGGLIKLTPAAQDGTPIDPAAEQSGVKRISYVCPKGFNGTYGIVLRKDWGELANNIVRVIVDTNVIPGEGKKTGPTCKMEPEGVVICFKLENGRRTESLEEGELTVANIRMSVAQQMLARNNALKRLSDDGVMGQILGGSGQTAMPSSQTAAATGRYRDRYPYLYGPSVVGYRPIITSLPDGAMLTTNAVVSADRRYVRLSPSPYFMAIRSVTSYNMASGADDLDSGSGGLGGGSSSGFGGGSSGMGGGGGW